MKMLIFVVAATVSYGFDLVGAVHPVRLQRDSYAKIPLQPFSNHWDRNNSVKNIQVTLQFYENSGTLLHLEGNGNYVSVTLKEGFVHILFGKQNGQPENDFIINDVSLTMDQVHVISVHLQGQNITTVVDNKMAKQFPTAEEQFNLNQASVLHIGDSQQTEGQSSTLPSCLQSVVLNGQYLMPPSDAAESRNLGSCFERSATACSQNYCADGGICYKTIECNEHITVEESRGKTPTSSNSSKSQIDDFTEQGGEEQWKEYKIGKLMYVHGFWAGCDAPTTNQTSRIENGNFSLQFNTGSGFYDYRENNKVKVFYLSRTSFLSWPVIATGVKVRVAVRNTFCHLTIRFRGCSVNENKFENNEYMRLNEWKVLIQTTMASLNDTLTSTGVINHAYDTPRTQSASEIKTKWLDMLPAYYNFSLSWKVKFIDGKSGRNIVAWLTSSSECQVAMDKYNLLQELLVLARGQTEMTSCEWERSGEIINANMDLNDLLVRVSIRRDFQATDAFDQLSNLASEAVLTLHPLVGDSPEECATACLKHTTNSCFGFQFLSNSNKSAQCQVFVANIDLKKLKPFLGVQLFILKDRFKPLLPLREFPKRDEALMNSDTGYECQCVNGMIGARCDNNSIHDYTYHVTISEEQAATELECPSSNVTRFVIKIQFSLGEISAVEKNPRVVHVVRALCNNKQNCTVSVEAINSLLPSSERRTKFLEIRYVCVRRNVTASTNKSSVMVSHTLATTAASSVTTTPSTEKEDTTLCDNCGEDTNFEVFENKHRVQAESGSFFLNLFEKPKETQSVMTSQETTTSMTTMTTQSPLETTTLVTSSYSTMPEVTTTYVRKTTANETAPPTSTVENICTNFGKRLSETTYDTNEDESECPQGAETIKRFLCLKNDQNLFKPVIKTECISKKTIQLSSELDQLTEGKISGRNVLQKVAERQTEVLTSQNDDVLPADIIENTKILQRIVHLQTEMNDETKSPENNLNVSESIFKSVDILLDGGLHSTWKKIAKEKRSSVADDLTQAVDNVGFLIAQNMNESKTTETRITNNTAIQVVALQPKSTLKTDAGRINFPEESVSINNENWMDGAGTIGVPFSTDSEEKQNFVFAVYNSLDSLLGDSYEDGDSTKEEFLDNETGIFHNQNRSKYVVNSCVISASVRPLPRDLIAQKKINIVLRHRKLSHAPTKCVFWKVGETDTESGRWSSDGCQVLSRNETHTKCECDHLTNFAILMNVAGVKLGKTDDFILSILTWVGCSMSIVCLVTCLFCFNGLRGLRSIRNSIHKNLCVTLALGQTIFLAGVDQTDRRLLCTFIAATLHYLFLSVFCWMSIEGLHLYVSLVQVFEIDKRSRLAAYYVFAYGAPALVVAVSAGIRYDGFGSDESCWLKAKDDYLIWSFVGPALAVICVNIGFFIVALKVMRAHRITTPAHRTRLAKAKTWIKGSSVLLCLLGITWIFGVFYVDDKTVVMAYIFTVCNALQGVFIFIFHCLMNDRVRAELSKYLRRSNCCPSCVRRRYHVTSSVTARSAYVTTASFGVKSRNTSSGVRENSSQTIKSSSWIKVKTPGAKLRKIVERQDTPYWSSDSPQNIDSNDKATNTPDDNNEVEDVPYFGLTVTNHDAMKVEEIDNGTSSTPSTNQQVDTVNSSTAEGISDPGHDDSDCSGRLNTDSSPSKSPSPRPSHEQGQNGRHDALLRHHSMPVPSRGRSVENSPRHERTIDDSLLFFNLDLSLNLQNLRM